jgi:hypothetical protein
METLMPFLVPVFAAIGGALGVTTAIGLTVGQILAIGLTVIGGLNARRQARKARDAARDAYNASLRDRMDPIRSPIASREMVLGRVRKTGAYTFVDSEGVNKEFMWTVITLAGHECDAIEKVYFNDIEVTIDGSTGAVSGGPYTKIAVKSAHTAAQQITSGVMTYTFALTGYVAGSASVVKIDSPSSTSAGDGDFSGSSYTYNDGRKPRPSKGDTGSVVDGIGSWSISGSTLTVTYTTLPTIGRWIAVNHDQTYATPRAWCWKFLGASGEDFSPLLRAAFPGKWTSAHQQAGCCKLLLKMQYDPDVYPQGAPTVSALIRGAKVLDIRSGVTAWSENPPLLIRHAATHPQFGKQPVAAINDADVIAAANACDAVTAYVVNGVTDIRPLYTAGIVAKWGSRPLDVIGELAEAMAGKFAVSAGLLSMKAGVYVAPSIELTDDDFSDVDTVRLMATAPRESRFNAVTGTFSDPANQYLQADVPKVAPSTYLVDDGAELPIDIELGAVNHLGQAQHVFGVMLRDSRQALTLTNSWKLIAYQLEVFDTYTITSSVFGWESKKFEVVNRQWSMMGGIRVVSKETSASIFPLAAGFVGYDPAPDSGLPSFWEIDGTGSLTVISGDDVIVKSGDGSYISAMRVSWPPIADKSVCSPSGKIEVAYIVDGADSGGVWPSVMVDGDADHADIGGIIAGETYRVRTRVFNGVVWSAWLNSTSHQVGSKTLPPSDVTGLAVSSETGAVVIAWDRCADADFLHTELRLGAVWSTATPLAYEPGKFWPWAWPADGTYTVLAKHVDRSGNESAGTASLTFTVNGSLLAIGTAQIEDNAATDVYFVYSDSDYTVTTAINGTSPELRDTVLSVTINAPNACQLNVSISCFMSFTVNRTGLAHYAQVGVLVGSGSISGSYDGVGAPEPVGTNATKSIGVSVSTSIPAGTHTVTFRAGKFYAADLCTLQRPKMRVELIKK